jgi:hypothetical protein
MYVYMLFPVFLLSCVGRGLVADWFRHPGNPTKLCNKGEQIPGARSPWKLNFLR